MTTVAVVGAGDIGGAAARALAGLDCVDRVLLYDEKSAVAAGKALDIQQAGAVEGFHTTLVGTNDPSKLIGCVAYVVADRVDDSIEWADNEGLTLLRTFGTTLGSAPIVFAGAHQVGLMAIAADELGFEPRRLVGSAPGAFAAALRAIIAMLADCSPGLVQVAVYGRPPDGLVVGWAGATIGGQPLQSHLTPAQMARLETVVPRLWPPRPYALGAAAAAATAATLTSSRLSHPVLAILTGEFGVRRGVGVVPARLTPRGIVRTESPALSAREHVQVVTALTSRQEARIG